MSSSISSSDDSEQWRRCLIACLSGLLVSAALWLALMMLIDPYDSGHFGWLGISGVQERNAMLANVSRARDPNFDSAILGDSTGQMINPAALSPATGKRFVQLVAPGADPLGHLTTLDFFMRHHAHVGAIVVVLDDPWCVHDVSDLPASSFPFWLYGDNSLRYLAELFNWRALNRAAQRIAIGLGRRTRTNPDGYWNYEEVWGDRYPTEAPQPQSASYAGAVDASFPLAVRLAQAVRALPADASVVLLVPPQFHSALLQPGTEAAAARAACDAAYKSIVAGRPRSNFINYRIDNALTRDPRNFVDVIHYRSVIARKLDAGIIDSIKLGAGAKIDF